MHTRVHTLPRACVRALYAPTRIVHCVPLEPVASQRWPSPRRDEERRGETRRGEVRRGWKTAKTARPTRARTHTHTRVHTRPPRVLGPRQLTSDGRKSFYVFILRATDPFYPPSTSPVRRLAFTGDGIDRNDSKIIGFLARWRGSTYWSRFEEIVVRI